jgi:nicotinamidase-related amidase
MQNTSDIPLATRVNRALNFFKPENLAGQKIKYHPVPGETAVLLVDVQKRYCDPRGKRGNVLTDSVSMKIALTAAAYRAMGLPVYVIHTGKPPWLGGRPGFHHFRPDPRQDILVRKVTDSGFQSGTLAAQLKADGRKKLLVCGFNLSACVKLTALDARAAGYDVKLIRDLCGNDSWNDAPDAAVRYMKASGIRTVRSISVVKWQAKR